MEILSLQLIEAEVAAVEVVAVEVPETIEVTVTGVVVVAAAGEIVMTEPLGIRMIAEEAEEGVGAVEVVGTAMIEVLARVTEIVSVKRRKG